MLPVWLCPAAGPGPGSGAACGSRAPSVGAGVMAGFGQGRGRLRPTTAWVRRGAQAPFQGPSLPQPWPLPWFSNAGETLPKRCSPPCWLPVSLPSADVSIGPVSLRGSAEPCGRCWGGKEELKGFFERVAQLAIGEQGAEAGSGPRLINGAGSASAALCAKHRAGIAGTLVGVGPLPSHATLLTSSGSPSPSVRQAGLSCWHSSHL